ncbi:hypothetical protein J53TS2_14910 [Paenibacillus sp. J53TS2]|uniref:hypothetical protein n=1 Tax=Paenibacillus TaxID=44249 RepID=UPI001B1AC419|nr:MULTISPECIES: hypothetical protein [Paenibacillus]GIP47900.1 hypothetical protein J53TS2_14910 [Paenibacillus sp. J53TS2]
MANSDRKDLQEHWGHKEQQDLSGQLALLAHKESQEHWDPKESQDLREPSVQLD